MKIKIDSLSFSDAITRIEKVINTKGSKALNNMFITAQDDKIKFIGRCPADPDIALIAEVKGEVFEEGTAVLHKDNFKLAKKLDKDITITADNNRIILEANKKLTFAMNDEYYPDIDIEEYDNIAFTIAASQLKNILKIKEIAAKDTIRVQLESINIRDNRFMACDGYRLAVCKVDIDNQYKGDIMMPLYVVELLDKVLSKNGNEELTFKYKVNNNIINGLIITGSNWQFIMPVREEQYIDVDKIMNNNYKIITQIDTATIRNTLSFTQEIKHESKEDPYPMILTITRDRIDILKKSPTQQVEDVWHVNSRFANDISGFRIGLNDNYLADAIKCLGTEEVVLKFCDDPVKPILVTNYDEAEQHLILPVRLRN